MKVLILVRHAKSSWADAGTPDFDRPLNERGKKDAPEMAQRLYQRLPDIDLFISSPARRARKTALRFAEVFGKEEKDLQLVPELYMADIPQFQKLVKELPDTADTAVIFSHNFGITAFVNTLTSVRIDDMPTCSIFAARFHTDHWIEIGKAEAEFMFFDYPKAVSR